MELEQRVKVLEQEVKILKNQIQTTLLDIQEQLLASKYPALRTDDDIAAPSVPSVQALTPLPPSEPNPPIIHKITLSDTSVHDEFDIDTPPAADLTPSVDAQPPSSSGSAWDDLARMNDWAAATVDRVGLERAQMLIMMYARRGLLSPEIEEALLEAVEVYVGHIDNLERAPHATPQTDTPSYDPDEEEENPKVERNLIMRLIKGLQSGGGMRGELWTRR